MNSNTFWSESDLVKIFSQNFFPTMASTHKYNQYHQKWYFSLELENNDQSDTEISYFVYHPFGLYQENTCVVFQFLSFPSVLKKENVMNKSASILWILSF